MHPAQASPQHYFKMRPQASGTTPQDANAEELRTALWYWGKVTREAVKNILAGQPDGSFLVRDALSKEGEYTLTLVKDGNEKLIKICHQNGKYGFVDCDFNSVAELINYYTVNSLKMYNKSLDMTLSNPILRVIDDDDSQSQHDQRYLADQFIALQQLLNNLQQSLDQKIREFKSIEIVLSEKKVHQEVYLAMERMFQTQMRLLESFINPSIQTGTVVTNNARQHDQEQLQQNAKLIKSRIWMLNNEIAKLNHDVVERREKYKMLEREINAAKPELVQLTTTKERVTQELIMKFGIKEEDTKQLVELGYDEWKERYESDTNQPHKDETLWLLKEYTRQDAEEILNGAPTGTFLIRARSAGHYALSIVCKNLINHCIINETETGYGFAAPYNIYVSLKELVEHYATNSLEEHNDSLTTTLSIPVLYWTENQEKVLQQLKEEELAMLQEQIDEEEQQI